MRPERARAEVGLGLAALGRPGYINLGHGRDVEHLAVERMERAAHDVLDAAYEEGVRAFDAARSYGGAEAFLASWLERRGLAPGEVQVSSKWGYSYTAGWRVDADEHEVKDLTATQLRRQWRETSALLGEHLGLYQIHSATIESGVLEDREVHAELAALRERGVRIGLTVTGPRQAATIEQALATGAFDAVQATWNLHERGAAEALARARSRAERHRQGGAGERAADVAGRQSRARAGGARQGDDGGCARALRGARAAVGGPRAQRSGDDGAAAEQPGGARGRMG